VPTVQHDVGELIRVERITDGREDLSFAATVEAAGREE
jgi:hypothetical protein